MKITEKKCPYCSKIVEGESENQAEVNLLSHKLHVHKDKIKIQEDK